jgi:cell division protein FtsB
MLTRQYKKRKTAAVILPLTAAAFLTYFGFHAWHGEFGIYSSYELVDRKARLETRLAELKQERHRLESRVALMQDGTIEKDMLDEQARRALNLTKPDEITIIRSGQ